MSVRGASNLFWPWIVSIAVHSTMLAAYWGYAQTAGWGRVEPRLHGVTVAAVRHRTSSEGERTTEEGLLSPVPLLYTGELKLVPAAARKVRPAIKQPEAQVPELTTPRQASAPSPKPAEPLDATPPPLDEPRRSTSLPDRLDEEMPRFSGISATSGPSHEMRRPAARLASLPELQPPPIAPLPRVLAEVAVVAAAVATEHLEDPQEAPFEDRPIGNLTSVNRIGQQGRVGSVGNDATSPQLMANQPPVYPRIALQNGWQGKVLLRLWVTESGGVERVKVVEGSGHAVLDEAADQAVRSWRFSPATENGHPVAMTVLLPVVFDLAGRATVSELSTSMSR